MLLTGRLKVMFLNCLQPFVTNDNGFRLRQLLLHFHSLLGHQVDVLVAPQRQDRQGHTPKVLSIRIALYLDLLERHVGAEDAMVANLRPNILDRELVVIDLEFSVLHLVASQYLLLVFQDTLQELDAAVLVLWQPQVLCR